MTDKRTPTRTITSRRKFLQASAAGVAVVPAAAVAAKNLPVYSPREPEVRGPVIVIASGNGRRATERAYEMITAGEDPLDAVIAGVNIVEADPNDMSVGYGGLPNELGVVQLDAAVMHGPTHQAGAVACIEGIKFPSRVAKLVMTRTDHVLLVGRGATEFARAHGFQEENLLTERARKVWLRWKETLSDRDDWLPPAGTAKEFNLDDELSADADADADIDELADRIIRNRPTGTIHCSGMNAKGEMSCVTTTSGLAFKIPGRVGDSPIIGAGLYVDNEVGSCGSTGRGEANLKNQCCSNAVELMRSGMTPKEAGLEICRRLAKHTLPRLRNEKGEPAFGLNFYLLRNDGEYAGVNLRGKAQFAVTDEKGTRLEKSVALFE